MKAESEAGIQITSASASTSLLKSADLPDYSGHRSLIKCEKA